jgi:hypothetical protein
MFVPRRLNIIEQCFYFASKSERVNMLSDEYNIYANKCTIVLCCSLITKYPPTRFGHLYGHLQGGINKNTLQVQKCQIIPPLKTIA